MLVFATLGAFAAGGTADAAGGHPLAPAVWGLILGPLAEQQLRRALTLSEGGPAILVSGPITVTLWAVVALCLCAPSWRRHCAGGGNA